MEFHTAVFACAATASWFWLMADFLYTPKNLLKDRDVAGRLILKLGMTVILCGLFIVCLFR